MKKAVTLLELMVVITIIGILVAMSVPMFTRAIENTRAEEAVAALEQIRNAERIYRVEENDYWPAGSSENTIGSINTELRLALDTRPNRNWDYEITATASPDTFLATAESQTGANRTETITIDQDGNFGGTWPLPLP